MRKTTNDIHSKNREKRYEKRNNGVKIDFFACDSFSEDPEISLLRAEDFFREEKPSKTKVLEKIYGALLHERRLGRAGSKNYDIKRHLRLIKALNRENSSPKNENFFLEKKRSYGL